jgi:hypothetical protein
VFCCVAPQLLTTRFQHSSLDATCSLSLQGIIATSSQPPLSMRSSKMLSQPHLPSEMICSLTTGSLHLIRLIQQPWSKADELVRSYNNHMHMAHNALATAHTMLNTNEFNQALISNSIQPKFPAISSTGKPRTMTSPPPRSDKPKTPNQKG